MSRRFNDNTADYISLGAISGADFKQAATWSVMAFFRVEETASDDRTIISKWVPTAGRVFRVTTDTEVAPASFETWITDFVINRTGNIIALNTWYAFMVSCDGSQAVGDIAIRVLDMSLTAQENTTDTHPGDETDFTGAIEIGVTDATGSPVDPWDGDVAHVCYVRKAISLAEFRSYITDPWRQVLAWRGAGTTVDFYLPLIGGSPEPDFSGSGNNGTINGSPTVAGNPPTAIYPADIPIIFPAGVTSAGLDTEQKRRAAIAVSHYAMAPSPTTDGAFSATDRAVIGYGYFDASTGQVVVSRSASDGIFVFDLLAQKKEIHVQREGVFAPDRLARTEAHVQREGLFVVDTATGQAIRFQEVIDYLFTPDQVRTIEEHVQSEGILLLERRSSIVEALQREGLLLDESSIGLRVFSRTVTEGLFLFDRQIHERAMVALEKLVLLETFTRVQEHIQREGLLLDESDTPLYLPGFNVISRSVSDGLLLSEMIGRIEEHIQAEGLLVYDEGDPIRTVTRAVSDGLLIIDRLVRAEEHLSREGIVLDENVRRVIELIQSEGLDLGENTTRTIVQAVVTALVWAKLEAFDPLGMVLSAQPDILGMKASTRDPVGAVASFVRNWG